MLSYSVIVNADIGIANPILKIDPSLMGITESNQFNSQIKSSIFTTNISFNDTPSQIRRVIVFTNGDLNNLKNYMHITYTINYNRGYLAFGSIDSSSIYKISTIPSVKHILPDFEINYNETKSLLNRKVPETDLLRVREVIGAKQLQEKFGINGKGVIIGIADTGVDFGAPDLTVAIARDSKGLPLQIDPDGQGIVLTNVTFIAKIDPMGRIQNWTGPLPKGINSNVYVNSNGVFLNLSRLWFRVYNPWYPYWGRLTFLVYSNVDFKIGDNSTHYIASKSGVYHFGVQANPLDGLLYPALVVDSKIPGFYDTVYIDLSSTYAEFLLILSYYDLLSPELKIPPIDANFYDESPHRVGDGSEVLARDFTGDGVADISAGLLGARVLDVWGIIGLGKSKQHWDLPFGFWGAVNGTLLPGLDKNGNFYGVMHDFNSHGTMAALSAVSRGRVGYDLYKNKTEYQLKGIAPGASIMAIKVLWWSDVLYGWMWASGFDFDNQKNTWVYSGEHRADIISNSWSVRSLTYLYSAFGYDILSILQNALSIPSYLAPEFPGTIFINSAGNSGYGYGTLGSPASASFSLAVGASTSNHLYGSISNLYLEKIEPRFGGVTNYADDIVDFSSRGPSHMGDVKPDLLNVGTYTFMPLPPAFGFGDGKKAFTLFGGTSLSAPLTAATAALIIQALRDSGKKVEPFLIKNILMSTAKDIYNDPFTQGAGRVDVERALSYALSKNGTFIAYTNATYMNILEIINVAITSYNFSESNINITALPLKPQPMSKWFAGKVRAGESSKATFTIDNPSNSTIKVMIQPTQLKLIKQVSINLTTKPHELDPLLKDNGGYIPNYINLTEKFGLIPEETCLLVIKVNYPFESFYNTTISPLYGDALRIASLYFYNWNDVNRDGVIWYNETSLINRAGSYGTIQEVRISNPLKRVIHTPLIGVYPVPVYISFWSGATDKNVTAMNYTLTVYYYKKAVWDWITIDNQNITIQPKSKAYFTATLNVPLNSKPGVYQAFITINGSNGQVSNIPFSVVVPIDYRGRDLPSLFGGVRTVNGSLYDNGAVYGAFDFFGSYLSGEWRVYAINIDDPTINTMSLRFHWSSKYTSLDIFAIDPTGRLIATSVPPGVFLEIYGFPSNNYLGGGLFFPSQNAGPNITILQVPINRTGTYLIIIHNTLFSGKMTEEVFIGELKLTTLLPDTKPPKLYITKPKPFVKDKILINFTAIDENLIDVKALLDGKQFLDLTNKSSIEINTKELDEGYHTIIFIASDTVGHETSEAITFYVDNTKPTLIINTPKPNSYLSNNILINFNVFDTNLNKVLLKIGNVSIDVTGKDSYLWNTRSVNDGAHIITIVADDKTGNCVEETFRVNVDNTKPVIKILEPTPQSILNGEVNIVFNVDDMNLDKVFLRIDNSIEHDVTTTQKFNWDTKLLFDGTHTIEIIAIDKASNIGKASINVTTNNIKLSIIKMIERAESNIELVRSAFILNPEARSLIQKSENALIEARFRLEEGDYNKARLLIGDSNYYINLAINLESSFIQFLLMSLLIIFSVIILSLTYLLWRQRKKFTYIKKHENITKSD
ncbi:MAG: S8 family serine peptidase [Nitrososphaerales archaeon]